MAWNKDQKIVAGIGISWAIAVTIILVFGSQQMKAIVFYGVLALWLVGAIAKRVGLGGRIERWVRHRARERILEIRRARWKAKVHRVDKPNGS